MCRSIVSVGWDGILYDCDFHQMFDMSIGNGHSMHIRSIVPRSVGYANTMCRRRSQRRSLLKC